MTVGVDIPQSIKGLPTLRTRKMARRHVTGLPNMPVHELPGGHSNDIFTGPGPVPAGEGEMSFQRITPSVGRHGVSGLRESQTPLSRPRGRPPGSGRKRVTEGNEADTPTQPQSSEPRRRGRPRGSKNSGPRRSAKPQGSQTTSTPGGVGSSIGYATRPSSGGVAVVINSRPPTDTTPQAQAQQGKPALSGSRKGGLVRRSIGHKVYRCRWNDCPYELHNLQTLRKHVHKHREQYADGPFPCCWADCGTINLAREETDERQDEREEEREEELIPLEFNTASDWEKHMDAKHLEKIAWEMGDGPSVPTSGTSGK